MIRYRLAPQDIYICLSTDVLPVAWKSPPQDGGGDNKNGDLSSYYLPNFGMTTDVPAQGETKLFWECQFLNHSKGQNVATTVEASLVFLFFSV